LVNIVTTLEKHILKWLKYIW